MKERELGGYDAWGVLLPTGHIRPFATEDKARAYVDRMLGMDVVCADGTELTLDQLHVVHRYIPEWTVLDMEELS